MRIEHIGVAVRNLDEAIHFYENVLGLQCSGIEEVGDQRVKAASFAVGETKVELLESTDPDGPVAKFIGKKGEGVHHITFLVENLPEALKELESKGVRLVDKEPRKGAGGVDVAFLHPASTHGVLIELCERRAEPSPPSIA